MIRVRRRVVASCARHDGRVPRRSVQSVPRVILVRRFLACEGRHPSLMQDVSPAYRPKFHRNVSQPAPSRLPCLLDRDSATDPKQPVHTVISTQIEGACVAGDDEVLGRCWAPKLPNLVQPARSGTPAYCVRQTFSDLLARPGQAQPAGRTEIAPASESI